MQKQKSYKKIILLLLTGLLTLLSSMSVFAKDNKGSIQILLTKGDIGTSVEIPTWDEEAGDMKYDVTVIPKHSPNKPGGITTNTDKGVSSDSPKTGDTTNYGLYIALLGASITLIALGKRIKATGGANHEK